MALKKNNISSNNPNQRDENFVHCKLQNTVKKMKENTNKWKGIPCSWIEKLSIVNMFVLLKVIYRFIVISLKISMALFVDLEK